MNAPHAKEAVLAYAKMYPVNATWLAEKIGARHRNNVLGWLSGANEPRDPLTWVRMAEALGLHSNRYERMAQLARELAVDVLDKSTDPELTKKAVAVVKEALAEYSPG